MAGNERIVHPVPRIFLLALLGIAAAVLLTAAQVSVLRAFVHPSSDSSSGSIAATQAETPDSNAVMLESPAPVEPIIMMPIGTRLILLAFNMGLICTLLFLMTLWSPRMLRRFLFGRGFGDAKVVRGHRARIAARPDIYPHRIIVELPTVSRQPAYSPVRIKK